MVRAQLRIRALLGSVLLCLGASSALSQECLDCHGQQGSSVSFKDGSSKDVTIDPAAWAASVHGQAGASCTDCHGDLIAGGVVPTVKLTKIHRTSEKAFITEFANQVRQKLIPQGYKHQGYEDFKFIDRSIESYWRLKNSLPESELKVLQERNQNEILADIVDAAKRARETMTDPISDFQVLSPMRKLVLRSDNLNRVLQEVLNPGGDEKASRCSGRS